jgi:hypothetical protein
MKRKGPFNRDPEIHGHHKDCSVGDIEQGTWADEDARPICICRELDYDDWIAAGEAEYDHRRENPKERTEHDE